MIFYKLSYQTYLEIIQIPSVFDIICLIAIVLDIFNDLSYDGDRNN